ncbi:opine metallophore biosynthesis dehydrogenase [Alkalihalophilus lindianensis]|uniref:Opine metallophore biosynthesis dehydrogenase n=1 Tax=Alkalihalophilus lindianensis TaxID=1630542 RepID=A0ABU3XES6_9BACI|nr:opine metallophore biosynthesis dehydrogenase [Alkalihalophilus lindianensis]MDV2686117.1 opine metallophore biosynthesis dehydrogenase [Alkalihalophilus lindianensis]
MTDFYLHLEEVNQRWDTVFYCTPSDAYLTVTEELNKEILSREKRLCSCHQALEPIY